MTHQMLCSCSECQRLDALPVRRQGIPGARQLLLVDSPAKPELVYDGAGNAFELVEMSAAEIAAWKPRGPRSAQRGRALGLEGLGLFDPGSATVNQPSLF